MIHLCNINHLVLLAVILQHWILVAINWCDRKGSVQVQLHETFIRTVEAWLTCSLLLGFIQFSDNLQDRPASCACSWASISVVGFRSELPLRSFSWFSTLVLPFTSWRWILGQCQWQAVTWLSFAEVSGDQLKKKNKKKLKLEPPKQLGQFDNTISYRILIITSAKAL